MRPGIICDGPIVFIGPKCVCLDTKITILSELEPEILKICRPFWKMVGHFGKWLTDETGLLCDGPSGIIAPKCVCLDTKITILSELEAEILKISILVGHIGKWPTDETGANMRWP